jgi:uncharacterized protein (DUF1810 family)
MSDPGDLARFVEAQGRGVYERAVGELQRGRKTSHWMWFIFPQIAGLGFSVMAQRFAIGSLDEARAYLAHPALGPRLLACVQAMLDVEGKTAREILGQPDDMKLRSSLTLFAEAGPDESAFREALAKYYGGQPDPATLEKLA